MAITRLSDHDVASLAAEIAASAGVDTARARRSASRAFRLAFGQAASALERGAGWSDASLAEAGIGRWARPHLLAYDPAISLTLAERAPSSDGTERLLLRAHDGALIESVIIPAEAGRDRARTTLCISSQVGCARACAFCETGAHGLTRQLTAGEIVDQYRIALALCEAAERPTDRRVEAPAPPLSPPPPGHKPRAAERAISNLVFMGMGEPFDNLPNVVRAISLLGLREAFDVAPSRITVSTVGQAEKIGAFFASTRAELAISLNAPDDLRRSRIMPINERYDLATLKRALVLAMPPRRRVLFQYALFADFNDSLADADTLARYVAGVRCRINVIPANPGPDPSLVAPSPARVDAFVARLRGHGLTTLVRRPRGRDVGGACGQLAGSRRLPVLSPAASSSRAAAARS